MSAARASGSVTASSSPTSRSWHIQLPEAVDDLGGRDLVEAVVAVAGLGVHVGRLEQPGLVVAAKGLDTQMGDPGELADRQTRVHIPSVHPPATGRVQPPPGPPRKPLDSPPAGGRTWYRHGPSRGPQNREPP